MRHRTYHYGSPPVCKGRQKQKEKETLEILNKQEIINKMAVVNPYTVITLNVKRLNSIKRHRAAGQIKKENPTKLISDLKTQAQSIVQEGDIPHKRKPKMVMRQRRSLYTFKKT